MPLNKVMLIGNVGKDPEVRYLEGGFDGSNTKVATFTLATTERFRDRSGQQKEHTEWHNIVAWRNSADVAEKYIRKGTQIYVEGKLRSRTWKDANGNDRTIVEVQVDNLQLLGRKSDNPASNQTNPVQSGYQQYQKPAPAPQQPVQEPQPTQVDDSVDDLPF